MGAVVKIQEHSRERLPVTETGGFRRGFMFVLSSPSGAGKTTLSRRLLQQDNGIRMSVSATTRAPRDGEVDGKDYSFITQDAFDALIEQRAFIEHATVFNHSYGTPATFVEESLTAGIDVLFDIDWQGTKQLCDHCRADLVSVFILPPSMQELEQRLRGRGKDDDDVVRFRMQRASNEISHWREYDYVVVNRDLEETLASITSILHAERLRRLRQSSLDHFVESLFAQSRQIGYD
ncbi:MAG: guanylate kinase [Alphaproteobacteria bacterium]|nr:MAG: guanylate kinase [Alphaproteobacteria bacterium]